MKRELLLIVLILSIPFFVFAEKKEFKADLDFDNIFDLFIQDYSDEFDEEEDVLKITINVTIKLLNKDGSIKEEIHFIDKKKMTSDEYDGCLGYTLEGNMIVRKLVVGRSSYKDYIDSYFSYDKSCHNWKLVKRITLESPQHYNIRTEKTYENENIYLYDKVKLKYSGGNF